MNWKSISRYDIVLVNLDPTIGHEIQKTRPCLVISPDEMNRNLRTILVAPITSRSKPYPTRVKINSDMTNGWIALDQIRTLDRRRIIKNIERLNGTTQAEVKRIIKEMLVD